MKNTNPKVSVVMPVFNREKYVADAANSILTQTFTDFEFIIVDDGSTDSTPQIIESFRDQRIKIVLNKTNKGNYAARNEGMRLASGRYICVMDSDDIALPGRIQKQFEFMETYYEYGLCGGFAQVLNSNEIITAPKDYDEIKVWSLSNIMFRHPTVFIRRELLKKYNLKYDASFRYAGDYDFLVKAMHLFPVTNIQEVLLNYRRHPEQISSKHKSDQFKAVGRIILKQLNLFKADVSNHEQRLHLTLMNRFPISQKEDFNQLLDWANFLLSSNNNTGYYEPSHLAKFLKSLLKYILKEYKMNRNPCMDKKNS